jgi:NADPH:quinone reductase-like Zn-dependent oxidoreductase
MKAVRFHEYGNPGVLRYEDVAQPVPAAGEVRIRVAATAFNPVDGNIRAGFMQGPIPLALPHTLGSELAGTVDALGEGADGFQVGDRVVAALPLTSDGGAAEYAVVPAGLLAAAPTGVDLADAAGLPLVGLTAWQALFDHAKLTTGQRILINGAGGVVGGYAIQLAKNAGAHVIAVTGPGSGGTAEQAGADEVHAPGIPALTEPVDVVLNLAPVAPEQLAGLVEVIRDGGVLVNTTVWMPAPSDEARGVRGVNLFFRPDGDQLAQLVALVDTGVLRLGPTRRVPLAELAQVHTEAAAAPVTGKVVVLPGSPARSGRN